MKTKKNGSGRKKGFVPWEPGQSGNPNGRPKGALNKVTVEMAQISRRLTMRDPKFLKELRERIRAFTVHPAILIRLLEYGYGKPTEKIELTLETNESGPTPTEALERLSVEELRTYLTLQRKMRGEVIEAEVVPVRALSGNGEAQA